MTHLSKTLVKPFFFPHLTNDEKNKYTTGYFAQFN